MTENLFFVYTNEGEVLYQAEEVRESRWDVLCILQLNDPLVGGSTVEEVRDEIAWNREARNAADVSKCFDEVSRCF